MRINLRSTAVSGAAVILPFVLTVVILVWLLGLISNIPMTGAMEITSYFYLNQVIKLFSLAAAIMVLSLFSGKLVRTRLGRKALDGLERVIEKVPLVGTIYHATKVTSRTVLGGEDKFGKPVNVEFGQVRLTGFKTGNCTRKDHSLVFVPTSPNITTGFVLEIDESWISSSEESCTEALTKVLSAGFGAHGTSNKMEEDRPEALIKKDNDSESNERRKAVRE